MGAVLIKKGFDIPLKGKPSRDITERLDTKSVVVYPLAYGGLKQRLLVEEGQLVKRGTALIENKANERFKICAPAGGKIQSIVRGERRFVESITITIDRQEQAETFRKCSTQEIQGIGRDQALDLLQTTGYLALIQQRPFSRMADPNAHPKAIFVNAMNSGPFRVDASVVAQDDPQALQAGLNLLTRLTAGKVYLCIGADAGDALKQAQNVEVQAFTGKHPSGNTSVHIQRLQPMGRHDVLWTVKAADLVLIGRLLLDGQLPTTRIIAIGGPGVKPEAARHYRVRIGSELQPLLGEVLLPSENRLLQGDVLSGLPVKPNQALNFRATEFTVLPEGREREFLGWMMPGFKVFSFFRTFISTWLGAHHKPAALTTNRHGGHRAMVLTGQYDRVMPLNIMVDFLIRAVLAGDTEEAIKLGILETDPEDFALCDFICPCKTEVQSIIRKGLELIMEEEGLA